MRSKRNRKVLLILDSGIPFHRAVMSGVGALVRTSELGWELRVEKQLPVSLEGVDGVIADLENPSLSRLLCAPQACPAVFVGSAWTAGPAQAQPRVCADNAAMIELAVAHLREAGVAGLACFSLARYRGLPWAAERLAAFREQAGAQPRVWEGGLSDGPELEAQGLEWLRALPARTGVVAVNDSSARELLQMCAQLGRVVPRDIAVVGIDNDPLVAALSPLMISSVEQASEEIGRKAAALLRRWMQRPQEQPESVRVLPLGLQPAATSSKSSSLVRGALDFMEAQLGCCIKAQQVADFMGVSRATLERTFLSQLGVTVHDELLRRRISLAKQLLQRRELSTAEVARSCGFRTQQYMHVVFKRELGLSPLEFAQSAALEADESD